MNGIRLPIELTAASVVTIAAILILPHVLELFALINATVYVSMAVLALSLALVWGFGGILCFGQATFFGLGGYAYAVAAINFGDTVYAVPVAIAVPALVAAALGYVMFYGRISDVYIGAITLTLTLILFNFVNSTSGDQWRIGAAPLGGFNGIPSTPPLNMPGDPGNPLPPEWIFAVAMLSLLICYIIAKLILRARFGRVIVAIRENERRAELLGYDVRAYKLGIFVIGGAMAGLSGLLFANCVFVSPTMFSLFYSGQIIVWVMVGGLSTLVGPVIGAILLNLLTTWAGTLPEINPSLILGAILALAVLVMPRGILPSLATVLGRFRGARGMT
ncbi:branched-chain amino acid ABC transporter permease [Acidiphilium sp.]|uniref:branched-chain amino acid ABC transporter permease n=1 Tax=Acidiphilium sp. TaxID=527 RepID=UPI002590FD0A|nr:branched-chain amino acid ABC transporter permease [Acidiphilium sp.]